MAIHLFSPTVRSNGCRARVAPGLATWLLACLATVSSLLAQPPVHYRYHSPMPPGAIGREQLERGGPLPGYFQPVEIKVPPGALVSLASEGQFCEAQPAPLNIGMLIAPVYRLRISNIPLADGQEVFPTVEVINRLYPPCGMERRFPIPIDVTAEDINLALQGKFVTRVIYLEDPDQALPAREGPDGTNWYDAGPSANPLLEADRLGRPMAILRMGGRLPDERDGPDAEFLFGCPPFTIFRRTPIVVQPPPVQVPVAPGPVAPGPEVLAPGTAPGQ